MRKLAPPASLARRLPTVRRFAARGEAALVVRNLPKGATEGDLLRAFEPYCEVISVKFGGATGQGVVTILTAEPEVVRDDVDGAIVCGRKIAVELASSAAPPTSANRPRLSGDTKVAILLNKQLIAGKTAADVLSLFEVNGAYYNSINIATSLHLLGVRRRSFEKPSAPLLDKLVEHATSTIVTSGVLGNSRMRAGVSPRLATSRRRRCSQRSLPWHRRRSRRSNRKSSRTPCGLMRQWELRRQRCLKQSLPWHRRRSRRSNRKHSRIPCGLMRRRASRRRRCSRRSPERSIGGGANAGNDPDRCRNTPSIVIPERVPLSTVKHHCCHPRCRPGRASNSASSAGLRRQRAPAGGAGPGPC
ncbi:hypothetical protein M885DRAFT_273594 [Pelagophyceae sp. CCMP2097]|nr:hypothetical protein M885DRAFT_273594 [Pelagophyceae sp. CCMP2097]